MPYLQLDKLLRLNEAGVEVSVHSLVDYLEKLMSEKLNYFLNMEKSN